MWGRKNKGAEDRISHADKNKHAQEHRGSKYRDGALARMLDAGAWLQRIFMAAVPVAWYARQFGGRAQEKKPSECPRNRSRIGFGGSCSLPPRHRRRESACRRSGRVRPSSYKAASRRWLHRRRLAVATAGAVTLRAARWALRAAPSRRPGCRRPPGRSHGAAQGRRRRQAPGPVCRWPPGPPSPPAHARRAPGGRAGTRAGGVHCVGGAGGRGRMAASTADCAW